MTSIARRTVLRGFAGASILACGGLVWRAWDSGVFASGEGPAYQPWDDWRADDIDGPEAIVLAGILAASAHNTQPWRFDIGPDRIAIFADTSRHLGSFDPFRREMMLSLGCTLENMMHAAKARGYRARIMPQSGSLASGSQATVGQPVALMDLEQEPGKHHATDLYTAIAHRHTHRGEYDPNRLISAALRQEMRELASDNDEAALVLLTDTGRKTRFAELTVDATEAIIGDPEMSEDSADWLRLDQAAVQAHRDGVTIDALGLPPLINAAAKMLPAPDHQQANQQWLDATRDVQLATAPLFGMIAVRDLYRQETALSAGRLWQRLHLWATTRGLAAQPINQLPEMVDWEAQVGKPPRTAAALARLTDDPSWRPTFAFRIGHAPMAARPSPRRALDQVISG